MANQVRGGIIQVQADGVLYDAKGNFTYNPGSPKREAIIGSDKVHGFTEKPQVAFVEGEFTDRGDLSLATLTTLRDATITLALANGKTFVLRSAWYASEGTVGTDEGNIGVRFESASQGQEV